MAEKAEPPEKPKGEGHTIFRPWITRDGKRVFARQYGLKAWPIWVPESSAST